MLLLFIKLQPSALFLFFLSLCSFEMWFDIDSLSEAENVVAAEREQNILSMLHQVGSQAGATRANHLLLHAP